DMEEKNINHSPQDGSTTTNGLLKTILIVTLLVAFSALLLGGFWILKNQAPRPTTVKAHDGETVMTKDSIIGGQSVFQKYGLMDYGTVLGNGSYMGPDYTAEALKVYTEGMQSYYAEKDYDLSFTDLNDEQRAVVKDKVTKEMRENRLNDDETVLQLTDAQVYGLQRVEDYYQIIFTDGDSWGLQPGLIKEEHMPETDRQHIADGDQIKQISHFFFWTAWLSSTDRIGDDLSYTNNW